MDLDGGRDEVSQKRPFVSLCGPRPRMTQVTRRPEPERMSRSPWNFVTAILVNYLKRGKRRRDAVPPGCERSSSPASPVIRSSAWSW